MSDDIELLARWQRGDTSAADALVRRYDPALERFFRGKTTEQEFGDLRQQVWLEVTKSRSLQIQRGFRPYLLGISRHVLLRHFEQKKRLSAWDPLTTSLVDLDLSLSQKVAQELGARDLRAVLQRLPLDTHLLLEARYLHEMSTSELAAMYDVPIGTIKSRLSLARKRLEVEMHFGRGQVFAHRGNH